MPSTPATPSTPAMPISMELCSLQIGFCYEIVLPDVERRAISKSVKVHVDVG